MSGVLRLGNTGAGTGRSTLVAAASNDQTFSLPSAGGTLLTSNYSVPGGTITFDGSDINITNGDLNVDSGTLFVDEANNRVGIGTTTPGSKLHVVGDILTDGPVLIGSTVVMDPDADELNIAGSGNVGLTIRGNTTNNIFFADGTSGDDRKRGQITYTHSNNALSFATNATTKVTIDNSGRVLVGTDSSRAVLSTGSPGLFQIEVQGGSAYPLTLMANRNDRFGPILAMCKSRGTTAGSQTVIQSGDSCGQIYFGGTDGSDEVGSSFLESVSVAAPVAGVGVPADITLTTADSSGVASERVRIESSGRFKTIGGMGANGGGANFIDTDFYRMAGRRTIPPNATAVIVITGLQNGWLTIKGGGYSSAGQSQFAVMYQVGGFMTATNTYDVETLQEWSRGATITATKNGQDFTITIVNNSATYTLTSNWVFETSAAGLAVNS